MYYSLIFSLQTPLTSILTNGFWSTLTALQCGEYSCPPLITVHLQGQKYILWDHLHFAFAKFTVVTSCWVTSIHTIIICTVKIELFLTPARAVSARRKQKWLEHWCALKRRLHKAFPSMFALVYHDRCLWETTGTSFTVKCFPVTWASRSGVPLIFPSLFQLARRPSWSDLPTIKKAKQIYIIFLLIISIIA